MWQQTVEKEKAEIKSLIPRFYKAIEEQNGDLVMNYFTPPVTPAEKEIHDWFIAADLPEGQRFFRGFLRVKIANAIIKSIEKLNKGKFRVNLTDDFQSWSNADPVGYGPVVKRDMIIIAVKTNNKWLIDEWDYPAYKYRVNKYSGFGQGEIISFKDIANWKTYKAEQLNLEFKYPDIYDKNPDYKRCLPNVKNGSLSVGPISIAYVSPDGLSLSRYVDKFNQEQLFANPTQPNIYRNKLISRDNIVIGNKETIKVLYGFSGASPALSEYIFIENEDKILKISSFIGGTESEVDLCLYGTGQKVDDAISGILSNFRFLK